MVTLERRFAPEQSDFRIEEYREDVPQPALIDDIVSYLGEYRFNLPKYQYEYTFSDGRLRNIYSREPMEDGSQRAIDKALSHGGFASRERAEKRAFQKLDRELRLAQKGNTIIWASPPGPKEEGFGDYGFVFFGKVEDSGVWEKQVKMTAMRVERPTIDKFNQAVSLLTSKNTNYVSPEDFLENPQVLKEDLEEGYVDSVLRMVFSFKPDEEEQKKFRDIISKMFPLISDFAQSLKNPWKTKAERRKELYTLENIFLERKKNYAISGGKESVIIDFGPKAKLRDMVGSYGYEPPKVGGSCPPTRNKNGSLVSSSALNRGSVLDSLFEEDGEWFKCPKCTYKASGPIGNTCPGCGLTKEEYAKETGVSCD